MSSALELICTNTVAHLLTIPETAASKRVPITEMFRRGSSDDRVVAEMPDAYPGYVTSLNDDEVEVLEVQQMYGSAHVIYRVPLYISQWVTTDGRVQGQAQLDAWARCDLTQTTLMTFTPLAVPVPGLTMWPLEPAGFEPIVIDASTYGILMKWWARYQLAASL